jgi:spore coat polysaccharide biosynthesis protein SpsF
MVVAIIQARLGSTRLPGKVLADICGRSLLEHLVERVRAAATVDKIVVATTESAADDELACFIEARGLCGVYRGSEEDVLGRLHDCARRESAELIVRVTADDPLKDPAIIDRAVGLLLADAAADYCSNTREPSFPEGLDIEVVRCRALEAARREAKLASEREHVTPYIWKNPSRFRLLGFRHAEDLSGWRWTVDKPEDLEFMRAVFAHFYRGSSVFSYLDVIEFLRGRPDIRAINAGTVRNEGYLQSLKKEAC